MYLVDLVGRRPLLITGIFFQTFFMFLLAGLGSHPPFNENTKHMIVACILLKVSWAAPIANQIEAIID